MQWTQELVDWISQINQRPKAINWLINRTIFMLSQHRNKYHTKVIELNHTGVPSESQPNETGAMVENALKGRIIFITPM